jgi:hypothetical protein
MYSSPGASDPFPTLIKSERDVGCIKFFAGRFPGTMTTTKQRMSVSAPKESAIGGKCQKVLSDASRATCCNNPGADQAFIAVACGRQR